tara:strand:- start:593 stop:991 length:399 start_codon:yes stop_codon:yes gene_type:complete
MKSDPMDNITIVPGQRRPPSQGPGSGKSAWVAYANYEAENNHSIWDIIHDQSATIRDLKAEIELMRKQIETRKPKGGRPRIDDAKRVRIEADLEAGHSKRSIAAHHRVSAMTVVRVAQRVAARGAVTAEIRS